MNPYDVPLFNFAWHPVPKWLEKVAKISKSEPWGKNYKVLELYLRANFEIAKQQSKVYEDPKKNIAFWRAGSLVNLASDPIWLIYKGNKRSDQQPWSFKDVYTGNSPIPDIDAREYHITYGLPEFHSDWPIHFEQPNIEHILRDLENRKRLEDIFRTALKGKFNEHLIFRAIYGEIELKRKEGVVISQWYNGDYQFLMPLYLTQADKVEMTAALQPDPVQCRYTVKTLLLPAYAYAYARTLVKSRASFADWIMLSEEELNEVGTEEAEEG